MRSGGDSAGAMEAEGVTKKYVSDEIFLEAHIPQIIHCPWYRVFLVSATHWQHSPLVLFHIFVQHLNPLPTTPP